MTFVLSLLSLLLASIAIAYSWLLYGKIAIFEVKNRNVTEFSGVLLRGSAVFLKKEDAWIGCFALVVALVLWVFSKWGLSFAFLLGGLCGAGVRWLAMRAAVQAGSRAAAAESAGDALGVIFYGGGVVGMATAGIGLAGVAVAYLFESVGVLAAFGMGASTVAFLARIRGKIHPHAAGDEPGIPEGDVGGVAAMTSDLFESYVNSIVAVMMLGFVIGRAFVAFPLFLAGWGIVSSILGCFLINPESLSGVPWLGRILSRIERIPYVQAALERVRGGDFAFALRAGFFASGGSMLAGALILSLLFFFIKGFAVFLALASGVAAGVLIGFAAEFFTSSGYGPVRSVAQSSEDGPAAVVLSGLSLGMKSVAAPVVLLGLAVLFSHSLLGGFGVGCAALGLLVFTGIALSARVYRAVAEGAEGIARICGLSPEPRAAAYERSIADGVIAALGRGLIAGSAASPALALFAVCLLTLGAGAVHGAAAPGLLFGAAMPFLFCACAFSGSASRAAQSEMEDAQREIDALRGIAEAEEGTDGPRVAVSTEAVLSEMVIPGTLAFCSPIVVGVLFGKAALAAFLEGAVPIGIILVFLLTNAADAWSGAKKYIEDGNFGGREAPGYAAAAAGAALGGFFKSVAAPGLNVFIKLMTLSALIFILL